MGRGARSRDQPAGAPGIAAAEGGRRHDDGSGREEECWQELGRRGVGRSSGRKGKLNPGVDSMFPEAEVYSALLALRYRPSRPVETSRSATRVQRPASNSQDLRHGRGLQREVQRHHPKRAHKAVNCCLRAIGSAHHRVSLVDRPDASPLQGQNPHRAALFPWHQLVTPHPSTREGCGVTS